MKNRFFLNYKLKLQKYLFYVLCPFILLSIQSSKPPVLKFSKYFVAAESYESVGVADINNDGKPDLISGDFWYENNGTRKNNFRNRHLIDNQKRQGEYYDDFASICIDVNADGNIDYITGGWFDQTLRWLENPGLGKEQRWKSHEIAKTGNIECIRAWDIDGDGKLEVVPNNPKLPLKYFKLENGSFRQVNVANTQGHGLGFGDIDGDGKGDFIVSDGWLKNLGNEKWEMNAEFSLGTASVPILVVDVNHDGKNDLIVGQGHDYGLYWYEQIYAANKRTWKKHLIDDTASQYHTMEWADLDNDGQPELITGKRFRAHNGKDPGGNDEVGLYYFKWNGVSFIKNKITYGAAGVGKGTGIYFMVADLIGSGRKDIIVAGKDGLFIFFNDKI